MTDGERAALEARIAEALAAGRLADATRVTIESYGPEVLGFLGAMFRDDGDARDVFSQFCEDLWRGMASYRGAASMRTWSYKLARHAAARFRRDPYRQRGRRLATEEYSELAAQISSRLSVERSHHRLDAARATLDPDDQALLVLRVDRKLAWTAIADVMADEDGAGADPDPATLRKRFERIKTRLRAFVAS